MNYSLGCAFNLKDMFINFPTKKLNLTCEEIEKITNDPHKLSLVRRIFKESMKIIFEDIIDHNNTFILPTTGNKKCDIHVRKIDGEEFKEARLNGAFEEIDLLSSNFSANQLSFFMYSNNRLRIKPIYLDKYYKNKLTENTNSGKLYC